MPSPFWKSVNELAAMRTHGPAGAVRTLFAIIQVVVPLAAAAQAGRCYCGAAIVPERTGWSSPRCYRCMPEDEMDVYRREKLEHEARAVLGIEYSMPVGPWERERRLVRMPRLGRRAPEPVVSSAPPDGPLRRRGERRFPRDS